MKKKNDFDVVIDSAVDVIKMNFYGAVFGFLAFGVLVLMFNFDQLIEGGDSPLLVHLVLIGVILITTIIPRGMVMMVTYPARFVCIISGFIYLESYIIFSGVLVIAMGLDTYFLFKTNKKTNDIENVMVDNLGNIYTFFTEWFNTRSIDKYVELVSNESYPEKQYTNTQFEQYNQEFTLLIDKLNYFNTYKRAIAENLTFEKYRVRTTAWNDYLEAQVQFMNNCKVTKCENNMLIQSTNHKKGFDGEKVVEEKLIRDGIDFIPSVNLEEKNEDGSSKEKGMHVELDFLIIQGNTIFTIEVKDYKADEIVLDASGSLYKVTHYERDNTKKITNSNQRVSYMEDIIQETKKEVIENILPQVNRHRRFIKKNISDQCNIINLIVFSNEKCILTNHLDDDNLKIVAPDYIINLVEKYDNKDKTTEAQLLNKVNELQGEELSFTFFDIEEQIKDLRTILLEEEKMYLQAKEIICESREDFEKQFEEQCQKTLSSYITDKENNYDITLMAKALNVVRNIEK